MPLVFEHVNCNIIITNSFDSVSLYNTRYSKFRIRTGSTQTTVVIRNPVDRIYRYLFKYCFEHILHLSENHRLANFLQKHNRFPPKWVSLIFFLLDTITVL